MKFKQLSSHKGIKHLVSEKRQAESCAFSLALHTGENPSAIQHNRAQLVHAFGERFAFVGIKQVHSAKVESIDENRSMGWHTLADTVEADALITNLPKVALTILTADCVPILLYDPVRGAIGAVHAGWKGTQAHILAKTIAKMSLCYGTQAEDLIVGIGPAIGGCCYEVGYEVAKHFVSVPKAVTKGKTEEKYMLDLKTVNQHQLLELGVLVSHIEVSEICTSCQHERFFSYRAEQGCSGRFISVIGLER